MARRCRNCSVYSGLSPWCGDCIRAYAKGLATALGTATGVWAAKVLMGL